jgi:hypothetical protein
MSEQHPSQLDLDLLRTGEADAGVRGHVDGCAACRERLAAQQALARRIARPLAPLSVPPELDQALARRAREQGPRVRRRLERRPWIPARRALPGAAAACSVLALGAFLALWTRQLPPGASPGPSELAGSAGSPAAAAAARADDVNADGRVDVVDAYLVALAVERGRASPSFDRNGDGRVDRRDAERIALAAVALGAGAGS